MLYYNINYNIMENVYKYIEQDNSNILLQKAVIDYTKYDQIIQDNGDILLKTKKIITKLDDLKNINFTNSVIVSCKLNNQIKQKMKYKAILEDVYTLIGSGAKIIKNTKLNIETVNKNDNGFYYIDNLGISVRGVDSNKCIYEIISQCVINKISINMVIQTTNNNITLNF